jgi:hypothetical protein
MWRSTVLILPVKIVFPGMTNESKWGSIVKIFCFKKKKLVAFFCVPLILPSRGFCLNAIFGAAAVDVTTQGIMPPSITVS